MSKKEEPAELDQDVARREKYQKLGQAGVPLFPYAAARSHEVREVVEAFAGLTAAELEAKAAAVVVPGRILSIRKMGRATFFHISDGRDRLQAYIREDRAGAEAYERFGLYDLGDVVAVSGTLFKTRTGELTVLCAAVTFLAKCFHPLPEKWHGLQDVELRYRQRYLDLIMNPEVGEVFRLRSAIVASIRRFFDGRGYLEVETPMMHTIPGGALARPFKTFHNALGLDLYLRIAPELYLKRLVVGGLPRVYEINRSFRNEGIDAQHNPEFTMLEFYEAYKDYYDMMDLTEELLTGLAVDLLGRDEVPFGEHLISFKRPYRRLKFIDACVQYSGLAPSRFEDRQGPDRVRGRAGPGQEASDLRQGPRRHLRPVRQRPHHPADLHHQPAPGDLAPGQDLARESRGVRALRAHDRRHGGRQRLLGADRSGRTAGPLRGAGPGAGPGRRGIARRGHGLRRGPRVRPPPDGRGGHRHRPPDHDPGRPEEHPGGRPVPSAEAQIEP